MTKVFSRPFGIEFEFGVDGYDYASNVADQVCDFVESYRFTGRRGWYAHEDCGGVELKTPPSTYRDWKEIHKTANTVFREYDGHDSDTELGTHIHMDISDLTNDRRLQWYHMWSMYEPLMFNMVERYRRSHMYCENVFHTHPYNATLSNSNMYMVERFIREGLARGRMSITPLSRHGTTEIRIHHCTTSVSEIKNWIELLQVMLHASRHFPMFTEARQVVTTVNAFRRMNRRKQRDQLVRFIRTRVAPRYRRVLATIDNRLNAFAG